MKSKYELLRDKIVTKDMVPPVQYATIINGSDVAHEKPLLVIGHSNPQKIGIYELTHDKGEVQLGQGNVAAIREALNIKEDPPTPVIVHPLYKKKTSSPNYPSSAFTEIDKAYPKKMFIDRYNIGLVKDPSIEKEKDHTLSYVITVPYKQTLRECLRGTEVPLEEKKQALQSLLIKYRQLLNIGYTCTEINFDQVLLNQENQAFFCDPESMEKNKTFSKDTLLNLKVELIFFLSKESVPTKESISFSGKLVETLNFQDDSKLATEEKIKRACDDFFNEIEKIKIAQKSKRDKISSQKTNIAMLLDSPFYDEVQIEQSAALNKTSDTTIYAFFNEQNHRYTIEYNCRGEKGTVDISNTSQTTRKKLKQDPELLKLIIINDAKANAEEKQRQYELPSFFNLTTRILHEATSVRYPPDVVNNELQREALSSETAPELALPYYNLQRAIAPQSAQVLNMIKACREQAQSLGEQANPTLQELETAMQHLENLWRLPYWDGKTYDARYDYERTKFQGYKITTTISIEGKEFTKTYQKDKFDPDNNKEDLQWIQSQLEKDAQATIYELNHNTTLFIRRQRQTIEAAAQARWQNHVQELNEFAKKLTEEPHVNSTKLGYLLISIGLAAMILSIFIAITAFVPHTIIPQVAQHFSKLFTSPLLSKETWKIFTLGIVGGVGLVSSLAGTAVVTKGPTLSQSMHSLFKKTKQQSKKDMAIEIPEKKTPTIK